jgi:glycosyltransferase involved in cell wall biosynthesis
MGQEPRSVSPHFDRWPCQLGIPPARCCTTASARPAHRMNLPLVSCVVITKDRRIFAKQTLKYIFAQTYRPLEVILVDSGDKPVLENYHHTDLPVFNCRSKAIIGTARNIGTEIAKGEIVAHFDDDDYHGPERIAVQVEKLLQGADICTADRCYEISLKTGKAYQHNSVLNPRYFSGGTPAFWKKSWERCKFRDIPTGEDGLFYMDAEAAGLKIVPWERMDIYAYVRHSSNGSLGENRRLPADYTEEVKRFIGKDWDFYEDILDLAPTRSHDVPPDLAHRYLEAYRNNTISPGMLRKLAR